MSSQTTPDPAAAPLDADERDRLLQVQRFLLQVAQPRMAAVAGAVGYDNAEHAQGLKLYAEATGANRPLSYSLTEVASEIVERGEEAKAGFRSLDEFENKWFPRVRTVLERTIPAGAREGFLKAFFDGLTQQAEGPSVVGSVETLLQRYDQLATNGSPGAKAAHALLAKRGLTAPVIKQVRDTIAGLKTKAAPSTPAVSAADRRKAAIAERSAFEELERWYLDWAETFRGEVGYHDAVRLGITERKGGRSSTPAAPPVQG